MGESSSLVKAAMCEVVECRLLLWKGRKLSEICAWAWAWAWAGGGRQEEECGRAVAVFCLSLLSVG
jgi:hypothetical protein